MVGATTGTDVIVPIALDDGLPDPTVSADDVEVPFGQAAEVDITVDPAAADGTVSVLDGATVLGTATLSGGTATVTIPANQTGAIGDHELTLSYSGEAGQYSAATGSFTLTVSKGASAVAAPNVGATYGQPVPVAVTVTGPGATPDGDRRALRRCHLAGYGDAGGGRHRDDHGPGQDLARGQHLAHGRLLR